MPTLPGGTAQSRRLAPRHRDHLVDRPEVGEAGQEAEHVDAVDRVAVAADDLIGVCTRQTPPRPRGRARARRRRSPGSRPDGRPPAGAGDRHPTPAPPPVRRRRRRGAADRRARRRTRYDATTSRTPGPAAPRALAIATARALIAASIRGSSSTSSERIARARSRGRHLPRHWRAPAPRLPSAASNLPVDAAEAAVGHHHHLVAAGRLGGDHRDDFVDRPGAVRGRRPAPRGRRPARSPTAARCRAGRCGTPARSPPRSAAPKASAKASWNTRRHDDADRGSKIAQSRAPGRAARNAAIVSATAVG